MAAAIERHRPEIIVVSVCDAQIPGVGSILMDAPAVERVHRARPDATIVASPMEAVDHAVLSRAELSNYASEHGFADRLRVPDDGETLTF